MASPSLTSNDAPSRARPRPELELSLPKREAFLRLPLAERRRRLRAVQDEVAGIFAGQEVTGAFLAEKRREAARES